MPPYKAMHNGVPGKQGVPFKLGLMLHKTGVLKEWINEHLVWLYSAESAYLRHDTRLTGCQPRNCEKYCTL